MEIESQTKAAYGEKNPGRLAQRNGYRDRIWKTRAGAVELRIPQAAQGLACWSPAGWLSRRKPP